MEGKENHLNAGNVKAGVSQVALEVKNFPANEGDARDAEFDFWIWKIP